MYRANGHAKDKCSKSRAHLTKVGALSKPRRRRQRGGGKTKDLMGRTTAQFERCKTLYISLKNKNMKSPKFASSANGKRDSK